MKFYNKEDAIRRMNAFGAQAIPFLFVIDYEARNAIVEAVADIDPNELLFLFPSGGNSIDNKAEGHGNVEWEIQPPTVEAYKRSFDIVQQAITDGRITLINLTCSVPIKTNLTLKQIFEYSSARYRLWIKDTLTCFSPEKFISISDGKIASFPMKGTINAALPNAIEQLLNNPKEIAEHAEVVELIMEDLSSVADDVRVDVDQYRYVEHLITNKGALYTTSSEVYGTLPADYKEHLGDIVFSQLPAGSITGFPKDVTIKVIAEAECFERKFYTGVMGHWNGTTLDSGVLIRFIAQENGELYFKAGGGITAKSNWQDEYNEVIAKVYVPIC